MQKSGGSVGSNGAIGTVYILDMEKIPRYLRASSARIQIFYYLLPNMRPPSWLWDHFYKGDKVNSTQHKGFCNYHTDHHFKILQKMEQDAAGADPTYTSRSNAVLLPEGP
jgi:hypothetical protein